MSARDDHPIATSANAWHHQWSQMCDEIDSLKGGPWVLWHYDPTYDDTRGGATEYTVWRSKAKAEEIAARLNEPLFQQKNSRMFRDWQLQHSIWAGSLRIDPEPVYCPVPLKVHGPGWLDEHYYVDALEVDG